MPLRHRARARPTSPEMQKDPALNVINQSGLNIAYWAFNTQKPPFDKKEVRQAFNMAIDKAVDHQGRLSGLRAGGEEPDPADALVLQRQGQGLCLRPGEGQGAAEEGRRETPLDIDLWYMPVQRPYNPNAKRIAEMMQADLAKVGVNAKLVTYEWGEYRKRAQQGEHMTVQLGWTGDNGDPDNFFFLRGCAAARPGGQNLSQVVQQGVRRAGSTRRAPLPTQAERTKLYEEMQVIEHEEAPDLKIAHSVVFEAMRKDVTGYKQSPLGAHQFKGVDVK